MAIKQEELEREAATPAEEAIPDDIEDDEGPPTFTHANGEEMSISDESLASMSIRELNELLAGQPESLVARLKSRRRLVKNRGYAQNTRSKRVRTKRELETSKSRASAEIQRLKKQNRSLHQHLSELRNKKEILRALRQLLAEKKAAKEAREAGSSGTSASRTS